MFMINNKIDLLVAFPITREFSVLKRQNGFAVRWMDLSETQWEIKTKTSGLLEFIQTHIENVSKYQREPFKPGSVSHQFIWHYEESIPSKVKDSSTNTDKVFKHRSSIKLLPEHFGKDIMKTYIKEQLKKRENEFLLIGDLSVFIGTWNCAGTSPNQFVIKWLRGNNEITAGCDIFVICLQEICPLSALNILGDEARETQWKDFLLEQVAIAYPDQSYRIVSPNQIMQQSLVGIFTLVLVKSVNFSNITNCEIFVVKLGFKGYAGNKGAICFRFEYCNSSICIINCHLAAHKAKVKNRNENIRMVLKKTIFQVNGKELKIYEHDFIFWAGDFNYRIQGLSEGSLKNLIAQEKFAEILGFDQLINVKKTEMLLLDFFETNILFPPTYKYNKGTSVYK